MNKRKFLTISTLIFNKFVSYYRISNALENVYPESRGRNQNSIRK
jgi:hypothetical protein